MSNPSFTISSSVKWIINSPIWSLHRLEHHQGLARRASVPARPRGRFVGEEGQLVRETWLRLKTRLSWRQTRNTGLTIAVGTMQGARSGVWLQLDWVRDAGRIPLSTAGPGCWWSTWGGPAPPSSLSPVKRPAQSCFPIDPLHPACSSDLTTRLIPQGQAQGCWSASLELSTQQVLSKCSGLCAGGVPAPCSLSCQSRQ